MKKLQLKQLIKECINELNRRSRGTFIGYVVVDLDRMLGAFWAGSTRPRKFGRSPLVKKSVEADEAGGKITVTDVEGQWEHITDDNGDECGYRKNFETMFSIFDTRQDAIDWSIKYLKGKTNPLTKKPFRYQVLSYGEWGRMLDNQTKLLSKGKPTPYEAAYNQPITKETVNENEDDYERHQYQSKINRFNRRNPSRYPCPTCKTPNALSAHEKQRGYQCSRCADSEEGVFEVKSVNLKDLATDIKQKHIISKPVKDVSTGEWVVKWMTDGKRDENKTYYTDDLKDAQDTSIVMSRNAAELNRGVNEEIPCAVETENEFDEIKELSDTSKN